MISSDYVALNTPARNPEDHDDLTVQQFFDFVKVSKDERLDDILTIKPRTRKYLALFYRYQDKKLFLHWNWAAYFVHYTWLFYRKMYWQGCLLIFLGALLTSITGIILVNSKSSVVFIIIGFAIVHTLYEALFNSLTYAIYMRHVRHCIHEGKKYKRSISWFGVFLSFIAWVGIYFGTILSSSFVAGILDYISPK